MPLHFWEFLMSAGQNVWVDRAATALVTLLLGASAQGLLSWREIGVLSNTVARLEVQDNSEHESFLRAIEAITKQQNQTVVIQAQTAEQLVALGKDLEEYKAESRARWDRLYREKEPH